MQSFQDSGLALVVALSPCGWCRDSDLLVPLSTGLLTAKRSHSKLLKSYESILYTVKVLPGDHLRSGVSEQLEHVQLFSGMKEIMACHFWISQSMKKWSRSLKC